MEKDLRKCEQVFKALANKRRLMIVSLLRKKKHATVGDIATHIKLSFRSTSRHLRVLSTAEVVTATQTGLYRHYRLNQDAPTFIRSLVSLL